MALSHSHAIDPTRLADFNRRKRKIDLVIVIACLPILVPLLLGLAVLLFLTGQRNPFFRQKRIGYQEQPFSIIKFRTMNDARRTDGALLPDAMRLTRSGKFLRRTSLDELPQIWNILIGNMSIVGPRPLFPHYLPYYTTAEQERHLVRPGVTGLAQVNGRNTLRWDDRLAMDIAYVASASAWGDVKIILKTITKVVSRGGVIVTPGSEGGRFLHVYRSFPTYRGYLLRELRADDLDERVCWIADPSTRRYMSITGDVTSETTRQWFSAHLTSPVKHDFAVVEERSGNIVAMVGMDDQPGSSGVSYVMVAPTCRGKGIGRVSQRLLYQWAFTHRGYSEVLSSVHKDNLPSLRIHIDLGAEIARETDERYLLRATENGFARATCQSLDITPLENILPVV